MNTPFPRTFCPTIAWLLVLVALFAGSGSAFADGLCGRLAKLPQAPPKQAGVSETVAMWKRINGPFTAVSGRHTELAIVEPGKGDPLSGTAYLCPGSPAIVYLSYGLVRRIFQDKTLPPDFLAFVLGHELGHRLHDFQIDGTSKLRAFARPGKGVADEEVADKQAALLAAGAGYSMHLLAKKDTVSAFLRSEAKLRPQAVESRKKSLLTTLETFDSYEELYQTALHLAISGYRTEALRLLNWSGEAIRGDGVPLPELNLVHAFLLLWEAASSAPWLEDAKLPAGASTLRCIPAFPAATAFREPADESAAKRSLSYGDSRASLLRAKALLDEAERLGAHPWPLATGRGCVAFYLGETSEAERAWKQARAIKETSHDSTWNHTLEENEVLTALQRFVRDNPVPDRNSLKTWKKRLTKNKGTFRKSKDVSRFVQALLRGESGEDLHEEEVRKKGCSSAMQVSGEDRQRFRIPKVPAALGRCPEGWSLKTTAPLKEKDSVAGLTVCVNKISGPTMLLRKLFLPATTEPSERETRLLMVEQGGLSASLMREDTWRCGCDTFERKGLSMEGDTAFRAHCSDLGLEYGAVTLAPDGTVHKVLAIWE